jgi:hypothetical protein
MRLSCPERALFSGNFELLFAIFLLTVIMSGKFYTNHYRLPENIIPTVAVFGGALYRMIFCLCKNDFFAFPKSFCAR